MTINNVTNKQIINNFSIPEKHKSHKSKNDSFTIGSDWNMSSLGSQQSEAAEIDTSWKGKLLAGLSTVKNWLLSAAKSLIHCITCGRFG